MLLLRRRHLVPSTFLARAGALLARYGDKAGEARPWLRERIWGKGNGCIVDVEEERYNSGDDQKGT
jgi:hypothetical protein